MPLAPGRPVLIRFLAVVLTCTGCGADLQALGGPALVLVDLSGRPSSGVLFTTSA